MRRPSRRTILKAIILLAAGAAVNVAVAWVSAWRQDDMQTGDLELVETSVLALNGGTVVMNVIAHSTACTWFMCAEQDADSIDPSHLPNARPFPGWVRKRMAQEGPSEVRRTWLFEQRGWPVRSLWGQYGPSPSRYRSLMDWNDADRAPVARAIALKGQTRRWGRQLFHKALPLQPLWPGFALNTAFYSAVLWMLFCGTLALRRRLRRRRGLCMRCAYPIGASDMCTECGAAIRHRIAKA